MRKSLLFLLATLALSWPLAFAYFAIFGTDYSWRFALMGTMYMYAPGLAACFVQLAFGEEIIRPLGISFRFNRWFFIAWLLPAVLVVAATGVSLFVPGAEFTVDPARANIHIFHSQNLPPETQADVQRVLTETPLHPFFLVLAGGLFAGLTINAVAGFGEELGWRGFLQREWEPLGFWRSSWLIGIVWGLWHTPFLIHGHNYPGHSYMGIVVMTIWTVLFTPLIAYVRNRAKSVIAASIMHGTLNGTLFAPALVIRGGDALVVGTMGLAGIIVLLALNLGLYWLRNRVAANG